MKKLVYILFTCIFITALSSCYVTRAYKYRKFHLKDIDKLAAVNLPASSTPFYFKQGALSPQLATYLDTNLANTYTYGFLVIRNDSILYEKYFDGLTDKTLLPSFSVAKSFVGTLLAIALEEGKIKSLQEPVTNYLPYLSKKDPAFAQITIQHLLDMRSGIKSSEEYSNPFSDVLKLGFTKNIKAKLKRLKIGAAPGTFSYKSVNTQLLAMIIEEATGKKIQDYLVEKIWQPLGMETSATWNIDSKNRNVAKAFCCINATAKDFAKLGRLYLNKGNWDGKQLVAASWINNTVNTDTLNKYNGYKNQWWSGNSPQYFKDSLEAVQYAANTRCPKISSYIAKNGMKYFIVNCRNNSYYAQGILDQYVFVNPAKNTIIVRLGRYWSHSKYGMEGFIYQVLGNL